MYGELETPLVSAILNWTSGTHPLPFDIPFGFRTMNLMIELQI